MERLLHRFVESSAMREWQAADESHNTNPSALVIKGVKGAPRKGGDNDISLPRPERRRARHSVRADGRIDGLVHLLEPLRILERMLPRS
jgi:hypothetical protein